MSAACAVNRVPVRVPSLSWTDLNVVEIPECGKLPPMLLVRRCILGFVLVSLGWVGLAWSSTFRPLPLSTLVKRSSLVVVATPISSQSHWATFGTLERVVTDVTLEVSWTLRGKDATGQDIIVRTLGGTVSGLAQIVYGEARLSIGQSCLLFLVPDPSGVLQVMGMAQGHYPTEPDDQGEWRIMRSPGLEGVLRPELSATETLFGRRLLEIPQLLETAEASP